MRRVTRRRFLSVAAGIAASAGLGRYLNHEVRSHDWPIVRRSTFALGAEVSFVARHRDASCAERAIDAAISEVRLVEELMSLYRADSQLSILNRDGRLGSPHPYLVEVLEHAEQVSRQTEGAFDITVQPLWQVYSAAAQLGAVPDSTQISELQANVDWRQVACSRQEVRFHRPGMRMTLNGIAQGYAADRAAAAFVAHGVEHALVNTGEIRALGESDRNVAWSVGVQHPRSVDEYLAIATLDGRALATSGDYATRFTSDARHHHILDPRSGRSPDELCSVSILAQSGMEADSLSTACFVLGVDKSMDLIAKLPGVDALFMRKDGEAVWTAGFPVHHCGKVS